jgi:PAS domain S-box-containing protein
MSGAEKTAANAGDPAAALSGAAVQRSVDGSEERYKALVESTTDYLYAVQVQDGRALKTTHGSGCSVVTGYATEDFDADPTLWYRMIHEEDRERVLRHVGQVLSGGQPPPFPHRIRHKDGSIRWVGVTLVPRFDEGRRVFAYDGLIKDITERKVIEEERERLILELQDALSKVKRLSGFLSICASCKKIRDHKGCWNQIESYIHDHSEAEFSHGLCPECARKLYPGYYKE